MREKVQERECCRERSSGGSRKGQKWVSVRGGSALTLSADCGRRFQAPGSGDGSGDDRVKCVSESWFGSRRLSISREEAGESVWYRLQAEESQKRWFILMSEAQLSWLQGVLQTAVMRGWHFAKGCVKKCGDRVIHVGRKKVGSVDQLQISEMVKNRRVYKLFVPKPEKGSGWAQLIVLLQKFYHIERRISPTFLESSGDLGPRPEFPRSSGRSFADVVKSGGFYGAGKCRIEYNREERYIEVENEGVKERKELLGRSLVLIFESTLGNSFTSSNAQEFLRWAGKNWAIDSNYEFHRHEKGSWLLVCPSLHQAIRIKNFDQSVYKSFRLSINHWKEEAREYNDSETQWVLASGIPLHLKSIELTKEIGKFIGSLVEVDWNHWASESISLRVRSSGVLPERIPIHYGGERYWIDILPASTPTHACAQRSLSLGDANSRAWSQEGMQLMGPQEAAVSRRKNTRSLELSKPGGKGVSSIKKWVRKFGPTKNPDIMSQHASQGRELIVHGPKLFGVDEGRPNLSRWANSFLMRMDPAIRVSVSPFRWLRFSAAEGLNQSIIVKCSQLQRNSFPEITLVPDSEESTGEGSTWSREHDCASQSSPVRAQFHSAEIEFASSSPVQEVGELPSPSCVPDSQDKFQNPEAFPFDEATLVSICRDIGKLIELDMEGGQEAVEELIENNARDMHHRKVRQPRSKLEMEKHRLGPISIQVSGSRRSRSRGEEGSVLNN